MPGACCTRGLVCNNAKKGAHEHTGTAGAHRHSLRNGLTAYGVLSLETNSSCLHRRQIDDREKPGRALAISAGLTPATGCQDHTLLPYATRLRQEASPGLVPARRALANSERHRRSYRALEGRSRKSALQPLRVPALPASTASLPTFVTTRDRPSCREETVRLIDQFGLSEKPNIFRVRAGQTFADLPVGSECHSSRATNSLPRRANQLALNR
jgi:hypothetical protein